MNFAYARTRRTLLLVTLFATGLSSVACANDDGVKQLPHIQVLTKSHLSTDESVDVWIREHLYQPGWTAPTHFHNSDLFIYVVSGSFEVATEEDGRNVYTSGQAVRMGANQVMDARNASDSEALKLSVVQVGGVEKPFVVPVE